MTEQKHWIEEAAETQKKRDNEYLKLVNRIKRLRSRVSSGKEYTGMDIKSMLYDLLNPTTK